MTEYAMMTQRINSGGINMAKRNRYRELENLMTKVILGEAAVFLLYLLFSYKELIALKVITAIITIVGSLLSLAWLLLTGEFTRRRSLWMVTGAAAVLLCTLVSLILSWPGPL